MDNIRTVSETKREFYNFFTKPISSIYRRFIEELLVEMHLLSVNADYQYSPIYALGVVTLFEKFMYRYQPDDHQDLIFNALCKSTGGDTKQYRQESNTILNEAETLSISNFKEDFTKSAQEKVNDKLLWKSYYSIAQNPKFKYSRLLAIGLYSLLEKISSDLVESKEEYNKAIEQIANDLGLSSERIQKDIELYCSNLEKMQQLLIAIEDSLEFGRKKRISQQEEDTLKTNDNELKEE